MKNTLSVLALGGILAIAACGPSEAEKKAAEQKKLDSIAAVEKVKLDSMAALAAEAAQKAAEAEAAAAAAQSEASAAKKDAKATKAELAKEKEEADKKAAEEAKKKEDAKKTGGKLIDKTGGTMNGEQKAPEQKTGKLKNKMN